MSGTITQQGRFTSDGTAKVSQIRSDVDWMTDVYNIFCVGVEANACVEQDGYSAQFIYHPPICDSPLALNATVGDKSAEVPRITNDFWALNLRASLA